MFTRTLLFVVLIHTDSSKLEMSFSYKKGMSYRTVYAVLLRHLAENKLADERCCDVPRLWYCDCLIKLLSLYISLLTVHTVV